MPEGTGTWGTPCPQVWALTLESAPGSLALLVPDAFAVFQGDPGEPGLRGEPVSVQHPAQQAVSNPRWWQPQPLPRQHSAALTLKPTEGIISAARLTHHSSVHLCIPSLQI